MIRSNEEILADIDMTLDRLVENAAVLRKISLNMLFKSEVDALQKTQESLLARLVHMNDLLSAQKKKHRAQTSSIEEKLLHLGKLNAEMIDNVSSRFKSSKPRIGPNRKKVKI